jgi:hypothetical protein
MAAKFGYGGNQEEDLKKTIGQMFNDALENNNFSRDNAKKSFVQYASADRRLDVYHKERLADRVKDCWYSGGRLDLDDPFLKGGQKRTLSG